MAAMLLLFCFCRPQIAQTTRSLNPVRRPSVGAVERGVWHGCQTRNDGPWMAHRDDPRSSAGARAVERSETRMPGALSLWLLSARVKRYGAKRSNSRRLARRVSAATQVTRRKGERGGVKADAAVENVMLMVGNEGLNIRWTSFALSTLRAGIGNPGVEWITLFHPPLRWLSGPFARSILRALSHKQLLGERAKLLHHGI